MGEEYCGQGRLEMGKGGKVDGRKLMGREKGGRKGKAGEGEMGRGRGSDEKGDGKSLKNDVLYLFCQRPVCSSSLATGYFQSCFLPSN
jgi:hypothetical protein